MKLTEVRKSEAQTLMDNLTHDEFKAVLMWLHGHTIPSRDVFEKLLALYSHEMPYGVLKARDGDPDEWIFNNVERILMRKNRYGLTFSTNAV